VEAPSGWVLIRSVGAGGLFKRTELGVSTFTTVVNWASEAERCKAAISSSRVNTLASELGVTAESLHTIGVGWADEQSLRTWRASGDGWKDQRPSGAYTFPEQNGEGKVVGLSLRTEDGRKGAPSGRKTGSKRGLVVPSSLATRDDPVCIVEGATDAAACEALGLAAVGRPSNTGGARDLAQLLRGRGVIVVGERDQKADGSWPGRTGAERVAAHLATSWKQPVPFSLPAAGSKDVREWLRSRSLDLSDTAACAAAGAQLLSGLRSAEETAEPQAQPSQAELLVRLALERYRIGCDENGEAFAVEHDGPNVALMFNGSRHALRAVLARDFRRRHNVTPNAAALADAVTVLEGEAQESDRERVFPRVGEHNRDVVLDLGRKDGSVVVVNSTGWRVEGRSPVPFRRSALTSELPEPQRGGSADELRDLVNVSDETWPLVLGWIVAAFLPSTPHPILMLGGLHGTGKSTAARMLVGLLDPSPAALRSPPSDDRQWAVAANASWAMVIDNVSSIPPWWSDALCKVVTGDGYTLRKLYTDAELTVLAFRRVVALTSIDPGALRGDLGDRLLLIDLEAIRESRRRTEKELEARFCALRPRMLGAILDIVVGVLRELPNVKLDAMPRLADFACVLSAMDSVLRTHSLNAYLGQRERIASDVVESDPVGLGLVNLMATTSEWSGTPTELLRAIDPPKPVRGWPQSARAFSARLKRLTPALRAIGIEVATGTRKPGGNRERQIALNRVEPEGGGTQKGSQRDGCGFGDHPAGIGADSAPEVPRDDRDGPITSIHLVECHPERGGAEGSESSAKWKPPTELSRPSQTSRNGLSESAFAIPPGRLRDACPDNGTVGREAGPGSRSFDLHSRDLFDTREVDDVG
jgi:hypothetical protein